MSDVYIVVKRVLAAGDYILAVYSTLEAAQAARDLEANRDDRPSVVVVIKKHEVKK